MQRFPIEFNHRSSLSKRKEFLPIYDEFKKYKSASKTHPRPTNKQQQEMYSISPMFGRDRLNADDNLKFALAAEKLTHIHIRSEDYIWVDEDGEPLTQWDCTSNSYLIYSYFMHKLVRYYFVITFIDNTAHASWDNENAKKIWLEDAETYRLSVISK